MKIKSALSLRLAAAILWVLLPLGSQAQITKEDYARAEQYLTSKAYKLMFKFKVEPHWIDNGDRFWYINETRTGREFWLVDPSQKTRQPAFDRAKLAQALSKTTGTTYTPDKLPFNHFDFVDKGRALQFVLGKNLLKCDLKTYECSSSEFREKFPFYEVPSPDGLWVATTKDHNLYVRSLETGEERKLTEDGEPYNDYGSMPESNQNAVRFQRSGTRLPPLAVWSPDSKKLVTHRLDQRRVKELHLIQAVPPAGEVRPLHYSYRMPFSGDEGIATSQLVIFHIGDKNKVFVDSLPIPVLYLGPMESKFVWWSENSARVYFVREERGFKSITLHEADAETGRTRTILEEKGPTYVEMNVDLYSNNPNVRVLANGAEIIWFSERDGWGHLYLYDGKTGALKKQITSGPWVVRDIISVDETKRQVYFTAGGREQNRDPYYRHLYRVNLDGSDLSLLTPEDADHSIVFSPSRKYFLDAYSRVDMTPTFVLRSSDGKRVSSLEEADFEPLLAKGWKWPERFVVKARDGVTDIYGIIHRPSHFDPAKSYPVLDDIYPGPQTIRTPKSFPVDGLYVSWFWQAQALAELGFIVINIDGLGTPFRSKAFHDFSYGNLGDGGGLEDHIAGLRQLAERYPFLDLKRVGIYGASSGGYGSARAILAYPDFYKVAVSSVLYSDPRAIVAWWGERYQGYPVGDNYKGHDLMSLAKNLTGKLLIAYGELDENSGPTMALQLVDALIKADKDFDLLVMTNRQHGFGEDPYFIRRRWDYFVKHLLKLEPPQGYKISAGR